MSFYKRKGRKKVNDKKKPRKFFNFRGFSYYTVLMYLQKLRPNVCSTTNMPHIESSTTLTGGNNSIS